MVHCTGTISEITVWCKGQDYAESSILIDKEWMRSAEAQWKTAQFEIEVSLVQASQEAICRVLELDTLSSTYCTD